ncbi:MAG: cytochrome c peroxidase [Granulosicoccaceae bacterium]
MSYPPVTILCLATLLTSCSSGDDATPVSGTSTVSQNEPGLSNACVASGSTRLLAQTAYRSHCDVPMKYCAPTPDQWMCASDKRSIRPTTPGSINTAALQSELQTLLISESAGQGLQAFTLPIETDLQQIPQDRNNTLTAAKVELGKFMFHDTGFALNGVSNDPGTWSCSACHNAAAGFKAGIPQGIGEGGVGYELDGSHRQLALGFDPAAVEGADNKPDLQPIAPPATLNVAYQEVVLWNGELGNAGIVNSSIPVKQLTTVGTPREANKRGFAGPETQAIAGIKLHRLQMAGQTPLSSKAEYRALWQAAYPSGSIDITEDAAKAIASYVRTILTNQAPFQQWLRGDTQALNETELQGAVLFFGDAGCSSCHQGPALSTVENAHEHEMFSAVGFADFDTSQNNIHGEIPASVGLGRGGFTLNETDNYKFKIPQLYNLADSTVLGHGASFSSIREVIKYKNDAVPQNTDAASNLDQRFVPLGLSIQDISQLTTFLTTALHDPKLNRYEPAYVPSGACITVDALDGLSDYRCNYTAP